MQRQHALLLIVNQGLLLLPHIHILMPTAVWLCSAVLAVMSEAHQAPDGGRQPGPAPAGQDGTQVINLVLGASQLLHNDSWRS